MPLDETLYRAYLSGDDDGLTALMERYGNKLTFYLDGYLHDIHEAEDLMIEAFAYLIAKKSRKFAMAVFGRISINPPGIWLCVG